METGYTSRTSGRGGKKEERKEKRSMRNLMIRYCCIWRRRYATVMNLANKNFDKKELKSFKAVILKETDFRPISGTFFSKYRSNISVFFSFSTSKDSKSQLVNFIHLISSTYVSLQFFVQVCLHWLIIISLFVFKFVFFYLYICI